MGNFACTWQAGDNEELRMKNEELWIGRKRKKRPIFFYMCNKQKFISTKYQVLSTKKSNR